MITILAMDALIFVYVFQRYQGKSKAMKHPLIYHEREAP